MLRMSSEWEVNFGCLAVALACWTVRPRYYSSSSAFEQAAFIAVGSGLEDPIALLAAIDFSFEAVTVAIKTAAVLGITTGPGSGNY